LLVTKSRKTLITLTVLACALASIIPASAFAADSVRTTFLFSRSLSGGIPNGPSRNATISNDQRIARVGAYESDASNIVAGDTNNATDIFFVRRAAPWAQNGSPWSMSNTELASSGIGGVPANGPSYKPTLDGSSHNAPTCIAFISDASNLVAGDTNGVADAFVRSLATGVITRVSVNSAGKQSNGPTTDITVDGDCQRVGFTAAASNLSIKSSKLAWKSATASGTGAGHRQVYVRILKAKGQDKAFKGLTFLASAGQKGKPGNGESYEPAFARAGKAITYTSTASNLAKGDRNPQTDVFVRTFTRKFTHVKGKGVQALAMASRLVSASGSGKSGNGPSSHPTSTDDGRYISYETGASNLLAGDANGVSDVARADLKGKKKVAQDWVSKSIDGAGNGASSHPVISGAGEFVLFDSDASNLRPSDAVQSDANGVRDMFLWNAPTQHVSLESRDWDNNYLTAASVNPATSSRGNYVLFESADPTIDQLIRNFSGQAQVYMRYLGPK
jgi:hypothetical protein